MIGRGCLSVLRDGYVVSFGSLSCISEYSAIMHLCFSGALLRLNFLVNVEHHQQLACCEWLGLQPQQMRSRG